MKKVLLSIIMAIGVFTLGYAAERKFSVENAVRSANVVRTEYSTKPTVYLYQGNGQYGSSYDTLGLHLHENLRNSSWGKTFAMNIEHMGRGKFNHDYLMPMYEITWAENFGSVKNYKQEQDYFDGTITTAFATGNNAFEVKTWFDPVAKSLGVVTISAKKKGEKVMFSPLHNLNLHYSQNLKQEVEMTQTGAVWKISLTCLGKTTTMYMRTNAEVQNNGQALVLTLNKGDNFITVSVGDDSKVSAKQSLKQTQQWWHNSWENSGFIMFPDDKAQKMWVRSMAMFLSSYDDAKKGLGPPMGYSGNWWPFYYPQDVSYVHPMLLMTGNVNIAKSWIEMWAERIDGLRAYTKRFYGVDGALAPWVYPYGSFEGYHNPGPPNKFFYEIHNSGYFARMAHETSVHVNDAEWTKKYALPIISGCAEFYANIASKEDDGKWHLFVTPSMGQDERGGENQKDYLCAMYSALYCFRTAVEHGVDPDGRYSKILNDGLAFESLKSPQGFYYSCAGSGSKDFGAQKHPVQLNELAFLPVGDRASESASIVYNLRYDITRDAKKPYFYGWTLGEFLLAGSRMGDAEGWKVDWANMELSNYVDPEWIQIYETSGNTTTPFYNITNGLVVQSLANNLVCDWYGTLELGKCNPWNGSAYVKNLRSLLGVSIDGKIQGSNYDVTLTAWRDCNFKLGNRTIQLKKGESIDVSGK